MNIISKQTQPFYQTFCLKLLLCFSLSLPFMATASNAGESASADLEAIKETIRRSLPKNEVASIEPTPIPSIFQAEMNNGEIIHITSDGKYLLSGDLLKIVSSGDKSGRLSVVNLTEEYRSKQRTELLGKMGEVKAITYPPKGAKKGEVIVFTDTDCVYCRKFHDEVPKLTAMGIEVSYLAWPRAGVSSKTGQNMVNIWCAKDQLGAMDTGKKGDRVDAPSEGVQACTEVVSQHRALGEKLGVRGTPAVYLKDGRQVGGYVPAEQLAKHFE